MNPEHAQPEPVGVNPPQYHENQEYEIRSIINGPFDSIVEALQAYSKAVQDHSKKNVIRDAQLLPSGHFISWQEINGPIEIFRLKHQLEDYQPGRYIVRLDKRAPEATPTVLPQDKDDFLPAQAVNFKRKQKVAKKKMQQRQQKKRQANQRKIEQLALERQRIKEAQEQALRLEREMEERAVRLESEKAARKSKQKMIAAKRVKLRQEKEEFTEHARAEAQKRAQKRSPSPLIFSDQSDVKHNGNQHINKEVVCDLGFVFNTDGSHIDPALAETFEGVQDRECARGIATNGWKKLNGNLKLTKCRESYLQRDKKLSAEVKGMLARVADHCEFYELKINDGHGARIFGFSYPNDQGDDVITIQPVLFKKNHLNGHKAYQCAFEEAVRKLVKNSQEDLPIFVALAGDESATHLPKGARNTL